MDTLRLTIGGDDLRFTRSQNNRRLINVRINNRDCYTYKRNDDSVELLKPAMPHKLHTEIERNIIHYFGPPRPHYKPKTRFGKDKSLK